MRKHYIFIPLKEKDVSSFRKALISCLWLRPFSCMLAVGAVCVIGYLKRENLFGSSLRLSVFSVILGILFFLLFKEIYRIIIAGTLKKSSLLPYIHTPKEDESFYSEELSGGFIIQVEPINYSDISFCEKYIYQMSDECSNPLLVLNLHCWITSSNQRLRNKAVIYIEIIIAQLEKGNKDILATCDKLKNYREDLL
ncbi:MAG: hypothetical protein IJ567_09885 [Lachnospiraceae bacterium]|nr:hypothetical protein [Lachnospiraceae bacterium]